MEDIVDQVIAQLKTLDLDDEDVAAYIAGIVQEDSIPNEEKYGAIVEFLAATTEKDTSGVVDQILKGWEHTQEVVAQAEARRKTQVIAEAKEREKARQQKFMEEKERLEQVAATEKEARGQKSLSKDDRAVRERIMQQYSYDNLDQKEASLGERNRNAEIIKEQDQRRRDQMKKQSETEKERNKMLLEKQRQKDEKDKKRTVKKEKRRM